MPPRNAKKKLKASDSAPSPKSKKQKQTETKEGEVKPESPPTMAKKPGSSGINAFSLSVSLQDANWRRVLKEEMEKDYFCQLEKNLSKDYSTDGKQIFPPKDLIFNAFNLTPLQKIKVVILGQDPYHDDGQAHGLSFSVPKGVKIPPSLRNIYKELEMDIPGFSAPNHGCLEKWAAQGVLLLNATLTVEAHKPNSHKSYGWQTFTDAAIQAVSAECSRVVFLLWGNFAHKKEKLVDSKRHCVIKTAHPSPLSFRHFEGCRCFSLVNKELSDSGISPIDWKL